MTRPARLPLHILGAGAASGTTVAMLIPEAWFGIALMPAAVPWGLNLFVSVAVLTSLAAWIVRRFAVPVHPESVWFAVAALALAAGCVWRASPELRALNLAALASVTILATFSLRGVSASGRYALDYLRAGVATAFSAATAAPRLALIDARTEPDDDEAVPTRSASGVVWGVLLAVPFVLLFGSLFASADTVFRTAIWEALRIDLSTAAVRAVHAVLFGALAAGVLREAFLAPARAPAGLPHAGTELGVPVVTALCLVATLFLSFVFIQVRYFFGGAEQVQTIVGLTYAEYARRGFFELVTASALVLPMLMAAEWAVRGASIPSRRLARAASVAVLVLLSVVMASAVVRLKLYVSAFGLTVDRFYAAAGLLYLALMFGWFAWTALRGQPARFVFGAAMLALGWLGTLHVINPDAFIARHNLARSSGSAFDAKYVAQLSSDAAPELVMALERFGGDASPASCAIAARLDTWSAAPQDWRTWNLAAARTGRMSRSTLRGSCEPVDQPEAPGD